MKLRYFTIIVLLFLLSVTTYGQNFTYKVTKQDSIYRLIEKKITPNSFGTTDTSTQTITLGTREQMKQFSLQREFQRRQLIDSLNREKLMINLRLQEINSSPENMRATYITLNEFSDEVENLLNVPFYKKYDGTYDLLFESQNTPIKLVMEKGELTGADSLNFKIIPFTLSSAILFIDDRTIINMMATQDGSMFVSENGKLILRRRKKE